MWLRQVLGSSLTPSWECWVACVSFLDFFFVHLSAQQRNQSRYGRYTMAHQCDYFAQLVWWCCVCLIGRCVCQGAEAAAVRMHTALQLISLKWGY